MKTGKYLKEQKLWGDIHGKSPIPPTGIVESVNYSLTGDENISVVKMASREAKKLVKFYKSWVFVRICCCFALWRKISRPF